MRIRPLQIEVPRPDLCSLKCKNVTGLVFVFENPTLNITELESYPASYGDNIFSTVFGLKFVFKNQITKV